MVMLNDFVLYHSKFIRFPISDSESIMIYCFFKSIKSFDRVNFSLLSLMKNVISIEITIYGRKKCSEGFSSADENEVKLMDKTCQHFQYNLSSVPTKSNFSINVFSMIKDNLI